MDTKHIPGPDFLREGPPDCSNDGPSSRRHLSVQGLDPLWSQVEMAPAEAILHSRGEGDLKRGASMDKATILSGGGDSFLGPPKNCTLELEHPKGDLTLKTVRGSKSAHCCLSKVPISL